MPVNQTFNGVVYPVPVMGDVNWGTPLTRYLVALGTYSMSPSGGSYPLTADLNLGSSYGPLAAYFKSASASIATAGVLRLANGDTIAWRNYANSGNDVLAVNSSDQLTFNGGVIQNVLTFDAPLSLSSTTVSLLYDGSTIGVNGSNELYVPNGGIANSQIATSAAIAYSKLNLTGSIINTDIYSAAAIALSKLASTSAYYWYVANSSGVLTPISVSASYAVATDSNGLPTVGNTTATELGYVHGVTSAIQTQLNAKATSTLASGDIFVGNGSNVATAVALSGDATLANTGAITLATVNASPGSTTLSSITTNGKGLVTANSSASTTGSGSVVLAGSPTLTGTLTVPAIDVTATTNQLVLGTTHTTTIDSVAPSASRTITIPDAGASSNMVLDQGNYTIAGDWTFDSPTTNCLNINPMDQGNYSTDTYFSITGNDDATVQEFMRISAYGPSTLSATNNVHWVRAGGTIASPSTVLNGFFFQSEGYRGYDGTAWSGSMAAFQVLATENWVYNTNYGMKFHFETTPNGSNSRTPILDITGAGLTLLGSSTIAMGSNKITGIANGTASTDAAAFGQIFTGFQAAVQATSNTVFTTTSNSPQSTNLSASITPTSSSHRIKVTVYGMLGSQAIQTSDALASIFRGSTNLGGGADSTFALVEGNTGNDQVPCSITYIDSPATTSSTTYTVKIWNDVGTATAQWGVGGSTQVMILEEIV